MGSAANLRRQRAGKGIADRSRGLELTTDTPFSCSGFVTPIVAARISSPENIGLKSFFLKGTNANDY
jgi:hypothetical protein